MAVSFSSTNNNDNNS